MTYKDMEIKRSYITFGEEGFADSLISPALKCTKLYRRSVGFFSSGVLLPIMDGIISMARKHGKIKLIASPQLSKDDIDAIELGYEQKEKIINTAFSREFLKEIDVFDDMHLNLLSELIARDILDIKIAVTSTLGIYHDKLGILDDFDGNTIVFFGSANSSYNGYQRNYEKIRLAKSWDDSEIESIKDEVEEFDSLWDGKNQYVTVYEYKESAQRNILKIVEQRKSEINQNTPIVLRDYQKEAIDAWKNNDYHGFYVMATGTGKTWTAIYSAKQLLEVHSAMIVICAPYKHLVKQWCEDVEKAFPEAKIVLVSSENNNWETQITQEIIRKKYQRNNQIIIISTIASFKMERFSTTINKSTEDKLLIVDEAHRFSDRSEDLKDKFKYMLGLSATPFSGTSAIKGRELMSFFGGEVFSLPIEKALNKGYLVPYNYYPIYVHSTEYEENLFKHFTQKIISCFKDGICINPDLLIKALRGRLRVISMSEEKQSNLHSIISSMHEKDHFVVYCGDGKLFDDNTGEEIRHIQSVKNILTELGYKTSQFTAKENMHERMQLVNMFDNGEISAMVAIRCLDEGINIPSITSALILSSNDDYREFVQRRGRILRPYKNKKYANIYDVIVLPSNDMQAWAKIEFRRFYEYAKLSRNWNSLQEELKNKLSYYNLSMEDVDVFDFEEMEEPLDE